MSTMPKVTFTCPEDVRVGYWKLVNMLPAGVHEERKVVAINASSMLLHRIRRSTHTAEFAVSATVNELLQGKTLPEGVSLRVGLPISVSAESTYCVPCEDLKSIHGRYTVLGKTDIIARIDATDIERHWEKEKPPAQVVKVKGWEEGSLSEAEVQFEKMCQSHDWYYQFSDSRAVLDSGDASWERLQAARKALGERGDMIVKFYQS